MTPEALVQEIISEGFEVFSEDGVSGEHYHGFRSAAQELGLHFEKNGNATLIIDPKSSALVGGTNNMVSSLVSGFALVVAGDKTLTNRVLASNSVSVPKQLSFGRDQYDEALTAFREENIRVVKPSHGNGGNGVTIDIESEHQFADAWNVALAHSKSKELILLEEQVSGFDARVIIVNGEFEGAVARIPAYVVGNGRDTISTLSKKKNLVRAKHPHHKRFPINPAPSDSSRTPQDGEIVFLTKLANIHQGGEAYDITDKIGQAVIDEAIKASRSVPGLDVVGIDFALRSMCGNAGMSIIEMNASANFGIHYTPYYGKHRNPARAILREMRKRHMPRSQL